MTVAPLKDLCILVVEDDYLIARDVRHALEEVGATVLGPVPSVGRALRLIEAGAPIDAAVLDVNLGDEKSFAVAAALQARAIPFLFATGYNADDVPAGWRQAPIVVKPFRVAALVHLLSSNDPR